MAARRAGFVLLLAPLVVSCGGGESSASAGGDVPASIEVTSTAFAEAEAIPERYTCDGDEVSPPLAWSGVPEDAAAVALVVDDPDAPSGTFTHWVVLDIPVSTTSSAEGAAPEGGVEAETSAGSPGYAGPCPPSGTHHYRFTIIAQDAESGLAQGASLDDALAAVDEHALARGSLTATYGR